MTDSSFYDDHDAGVEWGTPPKYVDPLRRAIGGFDLDPASGAEPRAYADTRFTKEDDGKSKDWFGDVWLNPPYGREENKEWATKVANERRRDAVDSITALVPANTGTRWFGKYYATAPTITLIHERIAFVGGDGDASFDSVIVSFGDFPDAYYDALRDIGTVFDRRNPVAQSGIDDF